MSCCCCCCQAPCRELLEGNKKKERLLAEEEGGGGGGKEEQSRRNMDISLLREQYRSSRENQRKHTQVRFLRTVSEELSDAVGVVPITQGLAPLPPDPTTYDPWRVHLDLHRRSRTLTLPVSVSETNSSFDCSSRCSSSSFSEAASFQQESGSRKFSVDLTPDSFSTNQENHEDRSRGDPVSCLRLDPVQMSVANFLIPSELRCRAGPRGGSFSISEENPVNGSIAFGLESSPPASQACSTEGSTPVFSVLDSNLHEVQSSEASRTPTGRGFRRFSSPGNRVSSHQSVEGHSPFTELQQNHCYPFPRRKAPRISDAARRLGMYSSI